MHTTHLRKVGGSVMLTIPPALLDVLKLRAGATVGLSLKDGQLVVEPTSRPRYQLAELLAQCDPHAPREEEGDWLDAPALGEELL